MKDDIQIVGEPVMDISDARKWQERLNALLTDNATPLIRLDMSNVEKIDTACLQLLVAFKLACVEKALSIEWHSPSARFLVAARALNLNDVLGISS